MTTTRRRLLSLFVTIVVLLPIAAAAALPLLFIRIGLGAAGARLGLWVGEPTVNDGEEYWAAPIGLYALSFLFGIGVLLVRLLRRLILRSAGHD